MLIIQNKNKLVGESLVATDADGNLIVWNVMGVYEYASDGVYQIHLRTTGPQPDKLFILTKEKGFMEGNAQYRISDRDDASKSIWVNRSNISNISSMVRTLRRIISHANN